MSDSSNEYIVRLNAINDKLNKDVADLKKDNAELRLVFGRCLDEFANHNNENKKENAGLKKKLNSLELMLGVVDPERLARYEKEKEIKDISRGTNNEG